MAPVNDKATLEVNPKRTSVQFLQDHQDDESDEGFVSPSVQRVGLRKNSNLRQSESAESECSNASTSSDNDQGDAKASTPPRPPESSSTSAASQPSSEKSQVGASATTGNTSAKENLSTIVETKSESLAKFIVHSLLEKTNADSSDRVERTLLKCVKIMMQKHEILFKGMMKRLQVTRETGYVSFVTVANTLFEDEKMVVTWSRIVALYAFGGQLALYCKEKNMEDFAYTVAVFMGKYSREVLTPFVTSVGGWCKICDEFPDESEIENKIRKVLSWTAVGLGVAATVSYLTSR